MAQTNEPSRNEQIKQDVFSRFALNRDAVRAFQVPGQNDPMRGQAKPRTSALQDVWTVFELYKVQTLGHYMRQDQRLGLPAEAREESFAYFESVQDVMRSLIYGARFSELSRVQSVVPEWKEKLDAGNPYAECYVLLAQMIPPATARGQAIQTDLARLLKGFVKTNGDVGAVERQIDPHLAVADEAVAAARAVAQAVPKP